MQSNKAIFIETKTFTCDGKNNDNDEGHPKVYLTFKTEEIQCPYCERSFIYHKKSPEK